jgi:hypothetical protein
LALHFYQEEITDTNRRRRIKHKHSYSKNNFTKGLNDANEFDVYVLEVAFYFSKHYIWSQGFVNNIFNKLQTNFP